MTNISLLPYTYCPLVSLFEILVILTNNNSAELMNLHKYQDLK